MAEKASYGAPRSKAQVVVGALLNRLLPATWKDFIAFGIAFSQALIAISRDEVELEEHRRDHSRGYADQRYAALVWLEGITPAEFERVSEIMKRTQGIDETEGILWDREDPHMLKNATVRRRCMVALLLGRAGSPAVAMLSAQYAVHEIIQEAQAHPRALRIEVEFYDRLSELFSSNR